MGRAINIDGVEGQCEGSVVMGQGYTLYENVIVEKGEFKTTTKDLSSEMGDVNEEGEFLDSVKLMDDASAVEKIEKNTRVQTAMKKARHLRLASLSFILFDDIYEAPVWHAVLKNWPLTNYFKREKPVTLEVSIEAVRGNTLSFRQII